MGFSYLFAVFLSIYFHRIKCNLKTILNKINYIGRKVEKNNKFFCIEVVYHLI
jgi:hypothetical protein